MSSALVFGFLLLVSYAVWLGTEQRLGSTDELRTLVGVLAAVLIAGGVGYLIG